jgi:hypothetical protein
LIGPVRSTYPALHPVSSPHVEHTLPAREAMKTQLIRISILQSSKIMTAMYAIMGLIYTLIGIPMAIFGSGATRIVGVIYIMGPVLMAVIGFIFFVIFAAIYNVLAASLGGFEFELKDIE